MQDSLCAFDLTTFLRALKLGAVPTDGFGVSADDIALVESACRILGSAVPSYGWVLALKDGRRLYLEYTPERRGSREELAIATLRPEQSGPTRANDAGIQWYRPDHINAYLNITPPNL